MLPSFLAEALLSLLISASIVALGYVTGRLLRYVVTLLLDRIGFNDWVRRISIGKAIVRAGFVPASFFGNLTAWIMYLSFILLALGIGSRDISRSLGGVAYLDELSNVVFNLLTVYVSGFVKAFLVIVVGFTLVDGFIGYLYKTSELRAEMYLLVPVAEYLRLLLYISIITFSLSVSGVGISELMLVLQPVIWGITVIMIAVVVEQILQRYWKR